MVQSHPAVILIMVAELRAQIACFDSWHVTVRLCISDLQDKRRQAVVVDLAVLVRDAETSKDQSVVRTVRKLARPPLRRVD